MKVLSVASEVFPLIKTGGLADVVGALPLALSASGVEMKTMVPAYPKVKAALTSPVKLHEFDDLLGEKGTLLEAKCEGLDVLVLDAPAYFDRPGGPYTDAAGKDHPDNWRRFAAFSRAGAEIAAGVLGGWRPDLVHVHDWQAAMLPAYMRYAETPEIPSVITIHNIAFQGQFSPAIFSELQLPPHAFSVDGVEYYGDVGFLKAGLQTATAITTVSPSYADEILQPEFGMGLEGLIAARVSSLHGIVNGIDTDIWNPETDKHIEANFSVGDLSERSKNRRALAGRFGLDDDNGPLFCVISRLTWQKGMDVLIDVVDDIVRQGGKLAVLGAGEFAIEGALLAAASRYRGRVGMALTYDEPLSHLMQAGADAILIPSRFEPCGLTQLYGLRYGCVPVVARTGGLADTVINANHAALAMKCATGFQFSPVTPDGMRGILRKVFRLYEDKKTWTKIQKQGMKCDVSWEKSAERYATLYAGLLARDL
ncbi:glycogen synthase GlgA [Rhizobium sp. NRK18]|uniref:glycogen synthase GlgA n=1 Tax=Rhizobium sp. NRK18 TaxID=2964667 RepID=UPI0021C310F4|nr:glycogen synthase GlgA [Rhizobium sp. NRK18]MCQ2002729.1 glycogen synthase GlgA [Rhizobium sp. NRK18]